MPDQPPITEEQLEFFTQQTERAVAKERSSILRNAFIGYCVLFTGVLLMYWNGQSVSSNERDAIDSAAAKARTALVDSGNVIAVSGCNRDFDTIVTLRGVLVEAQGQQKKALNAGLIKPEQYDDATEYFERQLKSLNLPDCRASAHILTDDPDATLPKLKPRFPDDKRANPVSPGSDG